MHVAVDGCRVALADWGRPFDRSRPTVLFLHGAGMDHTVWAFQARALAHHGCNALAPDLPGHGASKACPAFAAHIAERARWLARLLDTLGLEGIDLVGHSMGGLIALALAAADRRVRRLVLIGTAARMPVHPDLLRAAREDGSQAAALIVDWAFATARKCGAQAVPGSWMPMAAMRLLLASRPGVLADDLDACNHWTDGEAVARRITCPVLVLTGAEDRMTPPRACRQLAELIPHSQFRALAGAGHMPMLECPRELLAEIRRFLDAV
jgi:pimeloyl-ACP methyl ester carboxylesterase